MTEPVRVSLSSFTDYVNQVGTRRADVLEQQVERYTDKSRSAWWPYAPAERRCLEALRSADPPTVLEKMVSEAPRNMAKHYPSIRDGLLGLLKREAPQVVPAGSATWTSGELTIKINHVVGLQLRSGQLLLALLYFKEQAVSRSGARPALRIMYHRVHAVLPEAIPAVLDVRRAKLTTMPCNVDLAKLDRLLIGDAAGYVAHWRAAAA